jgi:hypothetical protein
MRKRMAVLLALLALLVPVWAMGQASPVLVLKTRIALASVNGRHGSPRCRSEGRTPIRGRF